jgi:hypothetical protein
MDSNGSASVSARAEPGARRRTDIAIGTEPVEAVAVTPDGKTVFVRQQSQRHGVNDRRGEQDQNPDDTAVGSGLLRGGDRAMSPVTDTDTV